MRAQLVNKEFTLISNNCCAGIIYSDLGLQFTSPTINLYFLPEDYLLFVKNLKAYASGIMTDVSDSAIASFPIGSLNQLIVHFLQLEYILCIIGTIKKHMILGVEDVTE